MADTTKFAPKPGRHKPKVRTHEAPRGALAHWIVIEDEKSKTTSWWFQTTWNASPRDPEGQRSAYESALLDTPVANDEQPLEILRTIHSFDPCMACAVHLYDEEGATVSRIQVVP